ncbi:MAG: hypothetical protein KJ655_01980 [Candidatus Thermoplasmatota archaeon]|nr:hypothetical protein [Candidatus Thermoplasmatota archaeon]
MDEDRGEKPFEGVLGNNCELRLLEYLLSLPNFDFNITELSRVSGVSRPRTNDVVKKFLEWKIVREKMKRGNMRFYELNKESSLVDAMYYFNHGITSQLLGTPIPASEFVFQWETLTPEYQKIVKDTTISEGEEMIRLVDIQKPKKEMMDVIC